MALLTTAIVGAGALTGGMLVKLIWGTEDVNASVIRAMASPYWSPSRSEETHKGVMGLLQRVAVRMRELPSEWRARVQMAEFDENIDVGLLDQGRLQGVMADVSAFLQDCGSSSSAPPSTALPPPPASSPVKLEAASVSYLVSAIIERMLSKAAVEGRHRDVGVEVIVGAEGVAVLEVRFSYKWDVKRSCMWRKVDLHMVKRLLWMRGEEDMRGILNALVWTAPQQTGEGEEETDSTEQKGQEDERTEGGEGDDARSLGRVGGKREGEGDMEEEGKEGEGEVEEGRSDGSSSASGHSSGMRGASMRPPSPPPPPYSSEVHLQLYMSSPHSVVQEGLP